MSIRIQQLFASAVVFVITCALFFHPITGFSQDLGRHLKLGELIFSSHQVPKINLFAYTYPNYSFINTHWLSEVIFYLLYRSFGTVGLTLFMIFLASMSITILFLFAMKRRGFIAAFIGILLYLGILLERTDLRPEILSFFFLSIFMVILYKNSEKFTRWIFFLPLVELLWVNMHIYFPVGIVIVSGFLLDRIFVILRQKHKISGIFQDRQIKNLSVILVLCCLATFINPNGITGALYPAFLFSNYGYSIQENQSLLFLFNYGLWFPWFTSILFVSSFFFLLLLWYRKLTSMLDWFLFIVFTFAAFSAVRNFSLFVFATYIPFVYVLSFPLSFFDKKLKKNTTSILQAIYFLASLVLTCSLLFTTFTTYGFGFGIKPSAEKAADFFIQNHLKGPLFNNFDIGSYLDFRLYPRERVFVDGRPEAYPADFFQKLYIPMQEDQAIFGKADSEYHFNTIFFAHTDATPWANTFLEQILKNQDWKLVYFDNTVIILLRNNQENQYLIQKFTLSENDIIYGKLPLPSDENSLYRILRIVDFMNWKDAEQTVLHRILFIDPHSCPSLQLLARNLAEKKDPSTYIYQAQYSQSCQ